MTTGLVLGKFAPLHRGHQLLIETALAAVDRLIVLVYEMPDLTGMPPLPVRAAWVRSLYPRADVIEGWGAPSVEGTDPAVQRLQEDYILSVLPHPVTHFFSSEWYGEHVSRALGARDVRVDMDRVRVPVTAREIRRDPFSYREFLDPRVYRDLVRKVVLLGAESTGKSTLAPLLAQALGTVWMPEHGRAFWMRHKDAQGKLGLEQLVTLAEEHRQREEERTWEADRWLVVDTNALTTAQYSLYYHGAVHPALAELAEQAERRYDLILLCGDDIPYYEDGTRGGPRQRARFQQQIVADLGRRGLRFHLLQGDLDARLSHALGIILASGSGGRDPAEG